MSLIPACGSDREDFDSAKSIDDNQPPPTFGGDDPPGDLGSVAGADDTQDPVTCESAARTKSYVGCDYWPTVTPNVVWSIFDFAVVVANTGEKEATITVTGPMGTDETTAVPAGELRKIFLPWVPALKGGDADECGAPPALAGSILVNKGAYHLVSSSPVTVYQFNALEYTSSNSDDGKHEKDWSACPGTAKKCGKVNIGCFSFSNDASLLLPSTAMTSTYRVMGYKGASAADFEGAPGTVGPVLSITATQPKTSVKVRLSPTAKVLASANGPSLDASDGGSTATYELANAGDVLELVAERGQEYDFSGSLVTSNNPVQVIASSPCINIPVGKEACDHIEETILPAETLGKHYVVSPPTGPTGKPVGHVVRFYGNKDDTKLEYHPAKPEKCPETLAAGQVADCDVLSGDDAFEVTGTKEFGVTTFLLGARAYDWSGVDKRGDPDQSYFPAVEQFRTRYVFLAPKDYPVLYADITAPQGTEIVFDGDHLTEAGTPIADSTFEVRRVDLRSRGKDGAHTLTATQPVGVQVIGFGDNTSFQYPAGLNLKLIAAPPPR